jgi:hypothetical protein
MLLDTENENSIIPLCNFILLFFLVVELILTFVSLDWDCVQKEQEIWWVDGCCSGTEESGRWWTTGLERIPMTGVCCCANSSIFTALNKVSQICNVAGTFVILDLTHDILYYYVCDWFN